MNRIRITYSKGKAKNKKYTFKRLWQYIYRYRFLFIMAFFLNILANVFELLGPLLSGYIMDSIGLGEGNVDFEIIIKYGILLLCFYISSAIMTLLISLMMIKLSKKIVYAMRHDAFHKLMELPIAYFDRNPIGDVISRLSYDIDTVNTSLSTDLLQICSSVITVIGSLVMMLVVSRILILVFVITIPVSFLFTNIMVKKTSKYFKKRSEQLGILNGYMEEMISSEKTIKAYAKEEDICTEFDKYNEAAADASFWAEYYSAYTGPGVSFVNNLSLSLICMVGALLYKFRNFSIGKISSFVLYSKKFSGPINEVANIITDLQSSLAAAERVFELIDEKKELEDVEGALALNNTEGKIDFKNVYFGYVENKIILKDVSFIADPGKVIAIVGPTGAGKSTIVNLLMRFYDANSGSIYLDNNNIELIKRRDLRESYAMVLQETWLFEGTIFDNIAYGSKDATMDDVKKAAEGALISSYINHLKDGYETALSEGGNNISKGQRQLLTIARAMMLKSNMLILDEATSNVDTMTEIKIQTAMKNLMKNKTCFVIAHRLSTIKNADLILVVKEGNIIEQGTHSSLLGQKGFYYELYNSQYK